MNFDSEASSMMIKVQRKGQAFRPKKRRRRRRGLLSPLPPPGVDGCRTHCSEVRAGLSLAAAHLKSRGSSPSFPDGLHDLLQRPAGEQHCSHRGPLQARLVRNEANQPAAADLPPRPRGVGGRKRDPTSTARRCPPARSPLTSRQDKEVRNARARQKQRHCGSRSPRSPPRARRVRMRVSPPPPRFVTRTMAAVVPHPLEYHPRPPGGPADRAVLAAAQSPSTGQAARPGGTRPQPPSASAPAPPSPPSIHPPAPPAPGKGSSPGAPRRPLRQKELRHTQMRHCEAGRGGPAEGRKTSGGGWRAAGAPGPRKGARQCWAEEASVHRPGPPAAPHLLI